MAESPQQGSLSRSDLRSGHVAVAERESDHVPPVAWEGYDPAADDGPRWTFRAESAEPRAEATAAAAASRLGAGEPRRSSFGPAGKHRTPAGVAVLSGLTLGLYSLVWHHRVNCEMGDFDPRLQVRPGRSTWAVSIPWLLGLAATLSGGVLLAAAHIRPARVASLPGWLGYAMLAGLLVVPYLVVLLPFSNLAVTMSLERLRLVQEHTGVPGDVQVQPVREVARLLIPLLGGLIVQRRAQRRLADVWDWADTGPHRRPRRP